MLLGFVAAEAIDEGETDDSAKVHFFSYSSYRFIFLSFFRKKPSRFRLQKYCKNLVSARIYDYQVLSEVLFSLIKSEIIPRKVSYLSSFYYFCKHERETKNIHIGSCGLLLSFGNASPGSEECFLGFHSESIFA